MVHRRAPERVVRIAIARVAGLEVVGAVVVAGDRRRAAGGPGRVDVINRLEAELGRVRAAVHRQGRILESRSPDGVIEVVDAGFDVLEVELGAQILGDIPPQVEARVRGDVLLEHVALDVVALQAVGGYTVGSGSLGNPGCRGAPLVRTV